MATFDQRESGWYQAKIRRKGHPVQSKSFEFKNDAIAWARDIENKMDRGIFQDRSAAEETLLGNLIERFITDYAEDPQNYKQRADKKEAWRYQLAHLKNDMGAYSLASIDQKVIKKYRKTRSALVADSTIRKEIYMLSKLFGYAEDEENITLPRGNPITRMSKPGEGKARTRRLSKPELGKLVFQCKASRNIYLWPAVELAIETGMRQGELLALRWSDVDLRRGIATIQESKNDNDEETGRLVPLSPAAIAVLKTLPRSTENTEIVIPLERMTLYHVYRAAVIRAGIKNFTFHDLRHEALSRLSERGDFSLLEMAAVSGHRTLQMLKRYNHQDAERLSQKLKSSKNQEN